MNNIQQAAHPKWIKECSLANPNTPYYCVKPNHDVIFTPSGKKVCIASGHGQVLVCEPGADTSPVKLTTASTWFSKIALYALHKTTGIDWDGHKARITSVAITPDGEKIATASTDSTVKLWRTGNGSLLYTIQTAPGVRCHCCSPKPKVSFSKCGGQLISLGTDKMVKVWGTPRGNLIHTLQPDRPCSLPEIDSSELERVDTNNEDLKTKCRDFGLVNQVNLSPDGTTLATSCEDLTTRLWNLTTGKLQYTLGDIFNESPYIGHTRPVRSNAFSPDGSLIATGSTGSKTINIWETTNGKLSAQLTCQESPEEAPKDAVLLTFSSKGSLACCYQHAINLWTAPVLENPQGICFGHPANTDPKIAHINDIYALAFSPDGNQLVSAGFDRRLFIWNSETGDLIQKLGGDPTMDFAWLLERYEGIEREKYGYMGARHYHQSRSRSQQQPEAEAEDEGAISDADRSQGTPEEDNLTIEPYYSTGRCFAFHYSCDPAWHCDKIKALTFSPNGERIASTDESGDTIIWKKSVS